jgi:DNA-directed RNA polymerases I, II, and III subunit RPABC2
MSTQTKKNAIDKSIKKEIANDKKNSSKLSGGGSGGGSGGVSSKSEIIDIKGNQNQLFQNQLNSRIASNYEHDYRDIMMNYDKSKYITRPKLTQYEKALILGKRATQIAAGAQPNITIKPGMTVKEIALEELREKKIPYLIKRPIGNTFEYWKLADLYVSFN